MNRTLKQAAALLGKPQRAIREHLRSIGAIYHDGTVTPRYHGRSLIYCDLRQRWVQQRGQYESYGVLMVTQDATVPFGCVITDATGTVITRQLAKSIDGLVQIIRTRYEHLPERRA